MNRILDGLKPERVYYYFEEISNIPRGSGNEKQVSDYIYSTFSNKGFDAYQDSNYNIIIKKPASVGYENQPTVMLQGHMDMVCEKNAGTKHDFEKDSIKLRVIDNKLYATGTTLGADNGVGVAMCLAVLEDENLKHPSLEIVITADEERGMSGAIALDCSKLKSQILINLDNGGEGVFTAGCAGGGEVDFTIPVKYVTQNNKHGFKLIVKGLIGGHSGADIHYGRGNANKIIGRLLYDIADIIEISSINGGSKTNAIPREAEAIISCNNIEELNSKISKWNIILKKEFSTVDKGINVLIESTDLTENVYDYKTKKRIIQAINLMPNGINTKNDQINLVLSSNNLGVVESIENNVIIKNSVRSSVENNIKYDILQRMKIIAEILDIKYEESNFYPGWEFEQKSFIRDLCVEIYEKQTNKKSKVSAIHAGLECGYFIEKMGKLDAVSFGPVMYGAHTPEENLDIVSLERTYKLLIAVLENINEQV